jgi:hypothetical protein
MDQSPATAGNLGFLVVAKWNRAHFTLLAGMDAIFRNET